jgi:hypothetical protein
MYFFRPDYGSRRRLADIFRRVVAQSGPSGQERFGRSFGAGSTEPLGNVKSNAGFDALVEIVRCPSISTQDLDTQVDLKICFER